MQLTARQREFVMIAGWALPVNITLGAVFGHLQAHNVWGYVQGAVATTAPIGFDCQSFDHGRNSI
jgi:hypothetical protein